MGLVRLWLFTPREGSSYPEGGTYDTSVLDTATGNCTDSHQEIQFQKLMDYAQTRGEQLQKVSSAQEAFALCSAQRVIAPPPPPGGGATGGCAAGVCGPSSGAGATGAGSGGGSTGGGSPATITNQGGSPSPGNGQLPGSGSPSPTSGQLPGASAVGTPTTTALPTDGFDLIGFLKGPMGMLGIFLVALVAILHRRL